ncbi:SET domain-containing protein-lysine N-methyltransferase [Candidatus Woesearchaeota archaeon]|nr:MAG: SET domain-containing protein-lysine N-methyltransferase [Candidatus Woesearchaeota archaeon]
MRESPDSPWILVSDSAIHGRGVFAKMDIPKGTKIIEYTGEKITKEESDKRQDRDNENGTVYIFTLDETHDIDGAVNGNDARFINHSCEENCEIEIDDGRIWVIAMRDIKQGEELGYDYSFDKDCYEEHPCKCGSKQCRGFILGNDAVEEMTEEQKKEWLERKAARFAHNAEV